MVAVDIQSRRKQNRDRRLQFKIWLKGALVRHGLFKYARPFYQGAQALSEQTIHDLANSTYARPNVQTALKVSFRSVGLSKTLKFYNSSVTAFRIGDALGGQKLSELLEAMAEFEALNKSAPSLVGKLICELLSTDAGREALSSAAATTLKAFPASPFLVYLRAVTLAKGGDFQQANDLTVAAIEKCRRAAASGDSGAENTRLYRRMNEVWRVVDSISRDNMAWADAKGYEAPNAEMPGDNALTGDIVSQVEEPDEVDGLVFSERLIQERRQDEYLLFCKKTFDGEHELAGKLTAIKAMLRQGLRRIPHYHDAYELAAWCFQEVRPLWLEISQQTAIARNLDAGIGTMPLTRLLLEALEIARKLRLEPDVARIENSLIYIAGKPEASTALWTIANALVGDNPDKYEGTTTTLVSNARRIPKREHEIRDYFSWALKVQRYDLAHQLYDGLSEKSKKTKAVLQYVRILQRDGQFERAASLARLVHEQLLANPGSISAVVSWGLIRRAGELDFAAETAKWYTKIAQPKNPKGIIFVAPRSIDQMRRFPLVVLMEMKKNGWAVVPLVKGALPLEKTGNPLVDQFAGCVTPERCIERTVKHLFQEVSGFRPDIENGKLRWNNVNLDHPLWEEAATNRRRYNVDYTCPALRHYLETLVRWTEIHAMALENIQRLLVSNGMRCGFMVLQQARLPDAVVRFYLEEFGDPENFFCIHSANGYQNYFANFSSPVSTRTTLRNMTRYKGLRTASFPVPSEFEKFYQENRSRGGEILKSVQAVTNMRRSTAGQTNRLPEAQACLDEILAWREKGGKVACLFGKVVCNSAVPFDGGPAHANMKDWLNDAIDSVRGSRTLLLIKPHPHEKRNEIGVFLTEYFEDLIEVKLPKNVIILGHNWFDLQELNGLIDLGVIYNGTTAAELGVLGVPCVLASHFAPIDYPVGHAVPKSRAHFRKMLRFAERAVVAPDLKERSAAWIHYMNGENVSANYRYHARQITNKVVYPPWWFDEDINNYLETGDKNVEALAGKILNSA